MALGYLSQPTTSLGDGSEGTSFTCPGSLGPGFLPAPAPNCYIPEPVPLDPAPEKPECTVKLEYRPVRRAGITWGYHADIVVHDREGYTISIEGTDEHKTGKLGVENHQGDIHDTPWGKMLTSAVVPDLCDLVDDILYAELNYSKNEVTYHKPGPNSNSLAHWLLQSGHISQYFSAPTGTRGWDVSLCGN